MKAKNFYFLVFTVVIFISTLLISILIAPYHINGDQEHYTAAYYSVVNLPIEEALIVYQSIIHTGEPIHFLLIWLFSSLGIEKNLIMALSNSILAILFAKFLYIRNYKIYLIALITLSNYYLLTMFFTLERTKFAFIFFLIAYIYKKRSVLLISVFTHSIILFPIMAYVLSNYINIEKIANSSAILIRRVSISRFKIFGFLLICFFVYYYLGDHLIDKFNSYAFVDFEVYQILIILFLTLISTSHKSQVFIFFLFIIISILILGGDRLNMLGYFSFLFFGNLNSKLFNQILLLLIFYYFVKCIIYVNMIITIGG